MLILIIYFQDHVLQTKDHLQIIGVNYRSHTRVKHTQNAHTMSPLLVVHGVRSKWTIWEIMSKIRVIGVIAMSCVPLNLKVIYKNGIQ